MNLFGKKKSAPPPPKANPVDAINILRQQLEVLEKREQLLQVKIDAQLRDAKIRMGKKDKSGALLALKRKKMYESEISKLMGTRVTLEQQAMALESAAGNFETLKAMQTGAAALKAVRGNVDAETIEDIMDDLAEEKNLHDEISDAIARPGQDLFDDEELLNELAELDALDEEVTKVAATSISITPAVPNHVFTPMVPTHTVQQAQESEEDRAMRELTESMGA